MVFIIQTTPAVNIPSRNIDGNQYLTFNISIDKVVDPIKSKKTDKKNPTHVDVHNVQLINSPKKS